MAELTSQERLQPSLLDRLADDAPDQKTESRDRRVLSVSGMRAAVIRDLAWLLNTTCLGASVDLSSAPEVARSVLNFGIVDLTGRTVVGFSEEELVRVVREAILQFEPRLARNTLVVKLEQSAQDRDFRAMSFRIEAELWAQPLPLQLYVKTEFDLESGHARIVDAR